MTRRVPLAAAVLAAALPATAAAQLPGEGFSSDNVRLVKNIATGPTSGARLLDGYLYVTTGRDLKVLDAREPEDPVEVGSSLYGSPGATEQRAPYEDPDTNGRVLIASVNADIVVFDVRDKTAPKVLSTIAGAAEHTVSCVLDCTYIYGSEGGIYDIRDPANPKEAGNWYELHTTDSTHDVTEVAPGIVLTSTEPMKLLDLRRDPTKPELLAEAPSPGFVHANVWPHQMADDILLVGGEGSLTGCPNAPESSFMTYSTSGWQTTKTFRLLGEFRMTSGTFVDGSAPATTFCVHWFDPHPTFRNTGLVAIGWYESGLRFLAVKPGGAIEEVGYWLPVAARTSSVYWRTDRIAYTADYYRGIDVIEFTGEIPAGQPAPAAGPPPGAAGPPTPVKRAVSFDSLIAWPSQKRCARARSFALRVRRASDPVTRVTVRMNGRRVATVTGAKLRKPVRLRKLPRRRRFTLQVLVRTKSGHQTAGQRTYRGC